MVCSWPGESNSFWDKRGGHGVWKLAKGLGIAGSRLRAPGGKVEKPSPADPGGSRSWKEFWKVKGETGAWRGGPGLGMGFPFQN